MRLDLLAELAAGLIEASRRDPRQGPDSASGEAESRHPFAGLLEALSADPASSAGETGVARKGGSSDAEQPEAAVPAPVSDPGLPARNGPLPWQAAPPTAELVEESESASAQMLRALRGPAARGDEPRARDRHEPTGALESQASARAGEESPELHMERAPAAPVSTRAASGSPAALANPETLPARTLPAHPEAPRNPAEATSAANAPGREPALRTPAQTSQGIDPVRPAAEPVPIAVQGAREMDPVRLAAEPVPIAVQGSAAVVGRFEDRGAASRPDAESGSAPLAPRDLDVAALRAVENPRGPEPETGASRRIEDPRLPQAGDARQPAHATDARQPAHATDARQPAPAVDARQPAPAVEPERLALAQRESVSRAIPQTPVLSAEPAAAAAGLAPPMNAPAVPAPIASVPVSALESTLPAQVEWLVRDGGGSARLRLDPPELGELEITVRVRGGQVELRVQTEQESSQRLVLDARERLFEALAARELRVESFEVRSGDTATGQRDASSSPFAGDGSQRDGRGRDAGAQAQGRPQAPPDANPTNPDLAPAVFDRAGGVNLRV